MLSLVTSVIKINFNRTNSFRSHVTGENVKTRQNRPNFGQVWQTFGKSLKLETELDTIAHTSTQNLHSFSKLHINLLNISQKFHKVSERRPQCITVYTQLNKNSLQKCDKLRSHGLSSLGNLRQFLSILTTFDNFSPVTCMGPSFDSLKNNSLSSPLGL